MSFRANVIPSMISSGKTAIGAIALAASTLIIPVIGPGPSTRVLAQTDETVYYKP